MAPSQTEFVQRQLADYIRNPEAEPGPAGIESRRLGIYRDLFYKNIENFIANGFPVLRSLISDEAWHRMIRDFMVKHQCHSPYFLEIGQEFLLYLQNHPVALAEELLFMCELAHYEWVELALDVADEDICDIAVDREGDLLSTLPVVSPLAWSLSYQFPVHLIGPEFQPQSPGEQATFLVVYRDRSDKVGFMEANSVTARLLELLRSEEVVSGYEAMTRIAGELNHPEPDQVIAGGHQLLQQLLQQDIILGTR